MMSLPGQTISVGSPPPGTMGTPYFISALQETFSNGPFGTASIFAMPQLANLSVEEARLQDYRVKSGDAFSISSLAEFQPGFQSYYPQPYLSTQYPSTLPSQLQPFQCPSLYQPMNLQVSVIHMNSPTKPESGQLYSPLSVQIKANPYNEFVLFQGLTNFAELTSIVSSEMLMPFYPILVLIYFH